MSDDIVHIALVPAQFGEREAVVARHAGLTASAFRYPSGVAALRIENGAGHLVLLPWQGQQIWDAVFLGRTLTMRSMFEQPMPTRDYLATYGAFFIHCGAAAMGNPGPADSHPLHGELPNACYDSAELIVGRDDAGPFMELTGGCRQTLAFSHDYVARPRLRLHLGDAAVEAEMAIENRKRSPMALMYLGHINFRPVDGANLVDTVREDRRDIAVRAAPPAPDAAFASYHADVVADPARHRRLVPGAPIEPELVLTMRAAADAEGWAHALQRHPDGSGDFVSHRPAELPHAVRWITRGPDQDVLGLVLPATAPPDGLAAATAKGQLVTVAPGATFRARMRFGALDPASAARLERTIATLRAG